MVSTLDAATFSTSAGEEGLSSFPLERPLLRVRRRDPRRVDSLLPYFIAGDENRLVSFVCRSEVPVFELGNPLLLIGPTGVGKSSIALHLAARQAVTMGIADTTGSVVFLPAVDFARRYAEAVAADDLPPLRSELEQALILVIDDLNLISDKPSAQEELATRIEARCQRGLPTILTCRRLPSEIRGMRPVLISRCSPGLTVSIKPPAMPARRMILRELAIYRSLAIEPEWLDQLASGLAANVPVRSLDAAIKEIDLQCRMRQSAPDEVAIQAVIDNVGRCQDLTLQQITASVAKRYRQKASDLRSGSRKQPIVRARSLAMFLARQLTSHSLHQIGDHFGGRDHSTVLHAIRKTESLLDHDTDLRCAMHDVTESLTA